MTVNVNIMYAEPGSGLVMKSIPEPYEIRRERATRWSANVGTVLGPAISPVYAAWVVFTDERSSVKNAVRIGPSATPAVVLAALNACRLVFPSTINKKTNKPLDRNSPRIRFGRLITCAVTPLAPGGMLPIVREAATVPPQNPGETLENYTTRAHSHLSWSGMSDVYIVRDYEPIYYKQYAIYGSELVFQDLLHVMANGDDPDPDAEEDGVGFEDVVSTIATAAVRAKAVGEL